MYCSRKITKSRYVTSVIQKSLETSSQDATSRVGTLNYISPETMLGLPYSFPTDVWGLGCILYELMTGTNAFPESDLFMLAQNIVKSDPLSISAPYSEDLIFGVEMMLQKDPSQRMTLDSIAELFFSNQFQQDFIRLGLEYQFGQNGKLTDRNEAMKYYLLAVDLGDHYGMHLYARGLAEGYLGEKDISNAMKYYKMSADLGNVDSMFQYGFGRVYGFLLTKDFVDVLHSYYGNGVFSVHEDSDRLFVSRDGIKAYMKIGNHTVPCTLR